jgi:hypothetical protein
MKNIIKCFALIAITFSLFSCDEESNFIESEIELVNVYSITEITGANAPFKINIYKNKSLIVQYNSLVAVTNYASSGYVDASTDTNYEISVDRISNGETVKYTISADKTSGVGNLTIAGSSTTVYTIKVVETEVYN